MRSDLERGGPVASLISNWPGSPRADALSLRLAGALHMAALSGLDKDLAAQYPAARPKWDPDAVWAAARRFLDREQDWVTDFLTFAPQTNETRRSIALLLGFLTLAEQFGLPMDLVEIGASAGLNQCWDLYCYQTSAWHWGSGSSVLIDTDWQGPAPQLTQRPMVRSRAACDLNPLDLRVANERMRLRAYIWADQADRLARFDAAAKVAMESQVSVERADAGSWLEARLGSRSPDALTVVYHSVFYQYPPAKTRERIAQAIEQAGQHGSAPLAWLRMEPESVLGGPRDSSRFLVDLVTFPGPQRRTLAITDGHARFIYSLL